MASKILLVDSRAENHELLQGLLRGEAADILLARSVVEARALLGTHQFAVAIIAIHLPAIDDIAFAEEMRGNESTQSIPIIFVTDGLGDRSVAIKGFEAGAVDFLFRPLDERIVRSKVKVFLELDRQRLLLQQQIDHLEATRKELVLSQKKLASSNTELERFAYMASHDLKEPLRMITTYLSLLSREYQGKLDAEADSYIRYSVDGAKRMAQLVESLMRFSEVGHSEPQMVKIAFEPLVREVAADLAAIINERQAEVTLHDLPTITADRLLMRQLFQNLISNAVKFGGDSPRITISSRQNEQEWVFAIADNGIGIPSPQRDRIFEPFVRGHSKKKFSGSGIGLSVCKAVVEKHGGRIWVESEEGKGSTFYFTVPSMPAAQSTPVI